MTVKDDIEEYFREVHFLVEASYEEKHLLWLIHHHEPNHGRTVVESWEDEGMGHGVQVGTLDKRPVCITMFYARLEGKRVCFWEPTSQVVDHEMIEKWLRARTKHITWDRGRWASENASNFHLCLESLRP